MFKRILLVSLCFLITVACNSQKSQEESKKSENSLNFNIFFDGKDSTAQIFTSTYEIRKISDTSNIQITSETLTALDKSFGYLNRKKKRTHKVGNLAVSDYQLLQTNQTVKKWVGNQVQETGENLNENLFESVKAYQIAGEDNRGNVHITGYFIPVIKVKKTQDEIYKYPLYKKPPSHKSKYSRKQIDDNNVAQLNSSLTGAGGMGTNFACTLFQQQPKGYFLQNNFLSAFPHLNVNF